MIALSATDVRVCEACWNAPVTAARHTPTGRDLLCEECTEGDYPRRVDLFPPFGVYGLTTRKVLNDGRHGSGPPKSPPDPGPPLPNPPPHRHRRGRRRCSPRPVTALAPAHRVRSRTRRTRRTGGAGARAARDNPGDTAGPTA